MGDMVVLQNDMSQAGMRRLHVMSSKDLDPIPASFRGRWGRIGRVIVPPGAEMKAYEDEIRLHHLEATWPAREPQHYNFRKMGGEDRIVPVVVWHLNGERISVAAIDAALAFYSTFEYWPSEAWVRAWPKGLKEEDAFIPIGEDFGLDLHAVRWVPVGFVVVSGNFNRYR